MRLILYFTVTFGFLQLISASGQGLVTPQRACRIRCENGGMCAFSFDNPSIHSCICLMGVYEGDRCQYQISPTSATVSTRTHQSNKAEHYTTLKIDRQNSGGEIERNEDLRRREQLDMERRRNEDRRREYELRIEEERRRLEEKRQMTMHPTTDDKVRDEQKRMEEYRRRAEERYREEERRRDEERRREFGRREEERIRENHRKLEEERRMIEEKRQQEQKRQEDMIRIMERERSQINDRKEKDKVKEEKAEENNVEPLEETEDWDYKSDETNDDELPEYLRGDHDEDANSLKIEETTRKQVSWDQESVSDNGANEEQNTIAKESEDNFIVSGLAEAIDQAAAEVEKKHNLESEESNTPHSPEHDDYWDHSPKKEDEDYELPKIMESEEEGELGRNKKRVTSAGSVREFTAEEREEGWMMIKRADPQVNTRKLKRLLDLDQIEPYSFKRTCATRYSHLFSRLLWPVMGEESLDIRSTAWRTSYRNKEEPTLNENNLPSRDPLKLFDIWFKNVATVSDLSFEEINAVCLSTVGKDYRPSCRMVLLKSFSDDGFAFYTNYDSKKGKQIEENPNAAMLFYWPKVHRQVRIEGTVSRLPVKSAIDYWDSRPIASRIGSKSSKQSSIIPNREFLLEKVRELTTMATKEGDASISKPESWGGYLLSPSYFEFWQGQSDRLHDRIIFSKNNKEGTEVGNGWYMYRLSP